MITSLLYVIPTLSQNRGIIGETNVRHIEVSVIRVKPFYNIIKLFLLFLPFKAFSPYLQNSLGLKLAGV